jgi:hypothetical protein
VRVRVVVVHQRPGRKSKLPEPVEPFPETTAGQKRDPELTSVVSQTTGSALQLSSRPPQDRPHRPAPPSNHGYRRLRESKSAMNGLEGEVGRRFKTLVAQETIDVVPIENFTLNDPDDVNKSEEVGESILGEMQQKLDQRSLGVDDSEQTEVALRDLDRAIPYLVGMASWNEHLEEIKVKIEGDAIPLQIDMLELTHRRHLPGALGQTMSGFDQGHDLVDTVQLAWSQEKVYVRARSLSSAVVPAGFRCHSFEARNLDANSVQAARDLIEGFPKALMMRLDLESRGGNTQHVLFRQVQPLFPQSRRDESGHAMFVCRRQKCSHVIDRRRDRPA